MFTEKITIFFNPNNPGLKKNLYTASVTGAFNTLAADFHKYFCTAGQQARPNAFEYLF